MIRPSSAPLSGASVTDIPVHDEIEPVPAAGAQALRLAGAWLTVLAFLEIASGLLVGCLFSSWRSHQESAFMVASVLGLFGACSLTATVSWRAATTHRPLAGVIAFTIGALALVVLLVPAASLLLPPNGLYGLDVNAVWSAARMPFSFAILVPAALMVFGTVRRWCVAGDALVVHRRTTVALAAALAILAPIGALVVVDAAQPACGAGRTCVPSAGISFVLPDGWSRTAPESEELYAATAGGPEARFVVEDGSRVLVDAGSAVPTESTASPCRSRRWWRAVAARSARSRASRRGGQRSRWGRPSASRTRARRRSSSPTTRRPSASGFSLTGA